MKFLKLFDVLDKMKSFQEDKVKVVFSDLKPSQFSNLKSHLYDQLMISLRLLHHLDPSVRIHELISFAHVLYDRGLYGQSLHQLEKAKVLATEQRDNVTLLEIIEFEKQIEIHHITRSSNDRAEIIVNQASAIRLGIIEEGDWSDLALKMYGYYLKQGHAKNKLEYEEIQRFFENHLPDTSNIMGTRGEVYKNQSYVWYYYIVQDFPKCYSYALKLIKTLEKSPKLIKNEPELYLKGMHNALSILFYCNAPDRFNALFKKFDQYVSSLVIKDQNIDKVCFVYLEVARLNSYFLKGDFTKGRDHLEQFIPKLKAREANLDMHRNMVFWYQTACIYFGADDFKNCILYLNKIINSTGFNLREDVQCFARILNLVAHYELGNDDLIDYQIRSTYRYLLKMDDLQKVQKLIMNFIKGSVFMDRKNLEEPFIKMRSDLELVLEDKHEWRPLLYIDLRSWLTSKIDGVAVEKVVQMRQAVKR
ncbi:MAG: hypothetical protein JKY54_10415 [Flavobacteriales bacterium]|nr:hypothetical protein [Flavobacteriales bacterium]